MSPFFLNNDVTKFAVILFFNPRLIQKRRKNRNKNASIKVIFAEIFRIKYKNCMGDSLREAIKPK